MSVITVSSNNSTRGSVAGSGTYTDGAQITITATANSGYFFACWHDGKRVVSSNPTYTHTVNGDCTLTAYFYSEIDGVEIYGMCSANCKHRVMNVGQVISLIQEMAANGWQVPTGYIPTTAVNSVVEQNTGKLMKLFVGTQKEWKDWTGNKLDVLFIPTDDTTLTEITNLLTAIEDEIKALKNIVAKTEKREVLLGTEVTVSSGGKISVPTLKTTDKIEVAYAIDSDFLQVRYITVRAKWFFMTDIYYDAGSTSFVLGRVGAFMNEDEVLNFDLFWTPSGKCLIKSITRIKE